MCDHEHGHNGCCGHGDSTDDIATAFSLYQKIDIENVECLNELVDGSGKTVFKEWRERTDTTKFVESDCDAELIFNIPFTGDVKLKGVIVIADEELHKMRLFKSNMKMTFEDVDCEPDQEFEIAHDARGEIEYPVKPTKFFNVHHLTMHFVNRNKNDDSKPCKIYYIGFRGEFTQVQRDGIVIANYEVRPTENISAGLEAATREVQ